MAVFVAGEITFTKTGMQELEDENKIKPYFSCVVITLRAFEVWIRVW